MCKKQRMGWRFSLGLGAIAVQTAIATVILGASSEPTPSNKPDRELQATLQLLVDGHLQTRAERLTALLEKNPDLPAAHWQNGDVLFNKKWIKYDQVADDSDHRAAVDDYNRLRGAPTTDLKKNLDLADFCRDHGLADRERFHLFLVLANRRGLSLFSESTTNESTKKGTVPLSSDGSRISDKTILTRLGFKQQPGGRWASPAEIAATADAERAAGKALIAWTPLMKQLAALLPKPDSTARSAVIAKFEQITDPAAIPAMEAILLPTSNEAAQVVVEQLGRMKAPEATYALAQLALFSTNDRTSARAAKALHNKPEDGYVPLLLSMISTPVEHRYEATTTADGRVIAKHVISHQGEDRAVSQEKTTTYTERHGKNVVAANDKPSDREQRDSQRIDDSIAEQNRQIEKVNARAYDVLAAATGEKIDRDPESVWTWWYDRNELYVSDKPTYQSTVKSQVVVNPYDVQKKMHCGESSWGPTGTPTAQYMGTSTGSTSIASDQYTKALCLKAGTPVITDRGPIAVEKIQPGDAVLSQSPDTGELAFKTVYQTVVRPPLEMVKVETAYGSIVASGGHPFWVVGEGWQRARQLKPGAKLYTAGDPVEVKSVSDDETQDSYNLLVADFHTYFAGEQKLLSHDNTIRRPVQNAVPGLVMKE